jgi:S-adenosylmethionine:tRNA ribosyltransferase-isomerase
LLVSDFDYRLPAELIAQEPLADREASRMLVLERATGAVCERRFSDFPELLRAGDLLVVNNTRVLRARLFGRRLGAHAQPISPSNPAARTFLTGRVEVLLTRQLDENTWQALVHPGRKIGVGERIRFSEGLRATVVDRAPFGERTLRFEWDGDFWEQLERLGHVPLPPYIRREDRPEDAERYQTVFARQPGSVAAPTAGLHFTRSILARLRERGVETVEVTLEVGLGTFQPVRVEQVEQHQMHAERYWVPHQAAEAVNRALDERRRVIAVGTTSVRAIEQAAQRAGRVEAGGGDTRLFIYPGYRFRVVAALLTNFHLPRSTLLMLVCAFGGRDAVLAAYRQAVAQHYRFYSYGDCMLVW